MVIGEIVASPSMLRARLLRCLTLLFCSSIPVPYPAGSCLAIIGMFVFYRRGCRLFLRPNRVLEYMEFTSGLTSTNSLIAQIPSKVYRLDLQSPPEELIGETSSREHFNDFIVVNNEKVYTSNTRLHYCIVLNNEMQLCTKCKL